MRAGFENIEKATDEVRATVGAAMDSAQQTARSLEEVRRTLLDRQHDEYQAELDVYREIVRDFSRDSLVRALHKATEDEVITPAGVRSPVWETPLHYRYVLGGSDEGLEVWLERDNGHVVSKHPWAPGLATEDFFQQLVMAVRDAGEDLGVGLNDPTQAVQELSEMLVEVAHRRSQELMGHRETLKRVVELRDGWYFTEKSLIPAENLSYVIAYSRLDEMDWEEHLLGKGWYGAPAALQFARELSGRARPRHPSSS